MRFRRVRRNEQPETEFQRGNGGKKDPLAPEEGQGRADTAQKEKAEAGHGQSQGKPLKLFQYWTLDI